MAQNRNLSHNTIGDGVTIIQGDVKVQVSKLKYKENAQESHEKVRKWREEGTCEWLVKKAEFKAFINSETDSCLWVHGKGDIIDYIPKISEKFDNTKIANDFHLLFFYVDYEQKENRPYHTMMATFIEQAQSNQSRLVLQGKSYNADRNTLRNILDKDQKQVYIIIDAVDQLPPEQRLELLRDLNDFFKQQNRGHRRSVIISSRSRDGCDALPNYNIFELQVTPDDINGDIENYLENKFEMSDLLTKDSELKSLAVDDIVDKSNGLFLWAKLQAEAVVRMEFKRTVMNHINGSIKATKMEDAYERYATAFKALPGVEKSVALRTIALLAHTTSSISINLLLETLNVDTSIKMHEGNSAEVENSSENLYKIVRRCSYLVEVDEKQGVFRFCHSSAFEFFRKYEPTQAHKLIAQVCLAYLCMPNFSQGHHRDAKWFNYGSLASILKTYPFLRFASCTWEDSYRKSRSKYNNEDHGENISGNSEGDEVILFFLRKLLGGSEELERAKNLQLSFQVYMLNQREEIPGGIRHEHIISYLGLVDLLDFLQEENFLDSQKVDEEGLSVVHWAIRRAAKLNNAGDFLEQEVSIVLDSSKKKIFEAVDDMQKKIPKVGDPMDSEISTVVDFMKSEVFKVVDSMKNETSKVVNSIDCEISEVKHFLDGEISKFVDSMDTEISKVVNSMKREIFTIVDSMNAENSQSEISKAMDSMDREISKVVRKLIECGASINVPDKEGRTPLYYAARYGMPKVVELLKKNKAELNMKDNRNQTALIAACKEHHKKVIAYLVEAGADLRVQSSCGTALQVLCLVGCSKCVELLLRNYEAKDPLQKLYPLAASNIVTKRLLSRYYMKRLGEGKGNFGTSLHAAAFHGRKKVVELLLDGGKFQVGATHHVYGSPLTAAAAGCNILRETKPYEDIFHLLISHGVNVNDEKGTRGPALRAAASNGHKVLVELLLQNKAKDSSGKSPADTAYQAAHEFGNDEIMQLLKDNGFDTAIYAIDGPENSSSGNSQLRQEFFRVAYTIAHKGNIEDLIRKAEKLISNELKKPEPTAKLSMMLALAQEIFDDTVRLAANKRRKGEQAMAKEHINQKEVRQKSALSIHGRRLRAAMRRKSPNNGVIADLSPSMGGGPELRNMNGESTSKVPILRNWTPIFSADDIDFTNTIDLMTKAAVAVLERVIETGNRKVKDRITYICVDALNNLMTSNVDGESLLRTVIHSRAKDFKAHLVDPTLSAKEQLNKAVGLASVAIELILVTFRHVDKFKRLSSILSDLYISAVNDVEDLGEHGDAAVRRLLQVVVQIFLDTIETGDRREVRAGAEAGVEVLRQAALNPKKNLIDTFAGEWVRQWEVMRENDMIGVVRDIINDRWQEYQISLRDEKYDQVLSLAITALGLIRAAFEQELGQVIEEFMPTLEKGFDQTIKSFHSSFAIGTTDCDQDLHIYETIVEGAFKLFHMAESKGSNRLQNLAEMIMDGIQETPPEALEKLEEVIASRIQVAKMGGNLKPREIAVTARYFFNLAGDTRKQFSLWLDAQMAQHEWLVRFEDDAMWGTHIN
ncbi:hypothetical protein V8C35DRAFT_329699, partial [Trichoderma chlorosporum]